MRIVDPATGDAKGPTIDPPGGPGPLVRCAIDGPAPVATLALATHRVDSAPTVVNLREVGAASEQPDATAMPR